MATESADDPKPQAAGLAWRLSGLMGAGRRLSFLALDPARRHFGQDWPRVAAKVHAVVSATLRSFLSEGDAHFPVDELSYAIVSSGRSAGEIDALMESISAEISSRITGKGMSKELVRILHLSADAAPDARRGRIAGPAALDVKEHASNIERLVQEAEACAVAFKIDAVQIGLSPILSTAAMSTTAWLCQPKCAGEDGVIRRGYDVVPSDIDQVIYAELDALTVEFAARHLKDTPPERQVVVQVPVHRTTLSSKKYRELYLKICQGMLANRRDRVVFDIYGIDEGTPSNRIAEYMQWLRPYAKAIAITLDPDFPAAAAFSGTGIVSVGIDVPVGSEAVVIPRIGKFVGRIKPLNMSCHVHGVSTKALAEVCLQLGVEYMDGDLILDAPSP